MATSPANLRRFRNLCHNNLHTTCPCAPFRCNLLCWFNENPARSDPIPTASYGAHAATVNTSLPCYLLSSPPPPTTALALPVHPRKYYWGLSLEAVAIGSHGIYNIVMTSAPSERKDPMVRMLTQNYGKSVS